jgi:hypothetical protein
MRAVTTLVSMLALLVSAILFYQLQSFTQCLADQQRADAARTAVIAKATDAERRADAALVAGIQPGGPDGPTLRRQDVLARQYTDAVRAANPPIRTDPC